ncbi:sugar ABC transporter substrate-binding protein [Methylocapsa sp. S129]|uniref:ABC transporter substrate-binding protein n=1 Tax=Methylocapsa sp. S129 TaxID=1641869 RepID=UPI00131CEBCF|nr:sugar ABC transporter substrate-binding protein [Methylocapsa sp. S129]
METQKNGRAASTGELTRRQLLRRGTILGGAAALTGFPAIIRAKAATTTLSFWQFYAPGGPVPAQSQWFEDAVAAWNAARDAKIQLEYVPSGDYMNGTKLPTAFASGQGPDIFLISPGDFLRYYNGGVLQDLTPYIDAHTRSDFSQSVIASRKVDDKIYGVPMEVEPMAFYYRKDFFDKAGLNENDLPKTWEQLLEIGKKLTTSDRFGLLFETMPGYYQNFTWYPFLWQGGGEIQGSDGKSAFNAPATIQALKFWQDAVKSGAAPRKPLGGGVWDIVPNLGSGYCAIQNCGIWGISNLQSGAKDVPYGIFKLPTPPGGKYVTVGGGWAMVANAKGKNPDAAGQFCAWALASASPDSLKRMVDWCTVAKSDMPPRQSAFDTGKAAFETGQMKIFTEQIYPGARAEPRVPPQVYKIVSDAIQACQLNGAEPAKQAETASQQLDAFLAGYTGAKIL